MLKMHAVETGYGDAQALFGIDLTINEGEIVTLLGRNGMGKTTTIRALMGLLPVWKGQIEFNGQDLTRAPPFLRAQAGIGLVPEGRQVFPTLSVEENLVATAASRFGNKRWHLDRIWQVFPRLLQRRNNRGNELSGGEQQMRCTAIGQGDEYITGRILFRCNFWSSHCLPTSSQQGYNYCSLRKSLQNCFCLSCFIIHERIPFFISYLATVFALMLRLSIELLQQSCAFGRRRKKINLVLSGQSHDIRRILILHGMDSPEQIIEPTCRSDPKQAFIDTFRMVENAMRNAARQPDQIARTCLHLLTIQHEAEFAFQHIDKFILRLMDMGRHKGTRRKCRMPGK